MHLFGALSTFYLRLGVFGVVFMVNDYSDGERGNSLPPYHGLLFPKESERDVIVGP